MEPTRSDVVSDRSVSSFLNQRFFGQLFTNTGRKLMQSDVGQCHRVEKRINGATEVRLRKKRE